MKIRPPNDGSIPVTAQAAASNRSPKTKAEAATRFEEVLVRQFVRVMTREMFQHRVDGEEQRGWMAAQSDMQGDVLTDVLTRHLVDSGALNISKLLNDHWSRQHESPPLKFDIESDDTNDTGEVNPLHIADAPSTPPPSIPNHESESA